MAWGLLLTTAVLRTAIASVLFLALVGGTAHGQPTGDEVSSTEAFRRAWGREVSTGRAGQRISDRHARRLIHQKLDQLDGERAWTIELHADRSGIKEVQWTATTVTTDGPFVRRGSIALAIDPSISMFGYTGRTRGLGRVSVVTRVWKSGRYVDEPSPGPPARRGRLTRAGAPPRDRSTMRAKSRAKVRRAPRIR